MANAVSDHSPEDTETRQRRRGAMAVLTCSSATEIAQYLAEIDPIPAHNELREPQSGLVMLRGRIGGDGAPFNFGEATVSRAAIRLSSGEMGVCYALGREKDKAKLIALCDAMIQSADYAELLESVLISPIRARLEAEREREQQQVAATKVEFFTLVRGEE